MQEILNKGRYASITILQGQCYPIRSVSEINDFLEYHKDYTLMNVEPEGSQWYEECAIRYNQFHFTYFGFKGKTRLQDFLKFIGLRRKIPCLSKVYGSPRGTWITLTFKHAAYILQYLLEYRKLARFSKYTWASDEFLFPSILMNSIFSNEIIPDRNRFIKWTKGKANTDILTLCGINEILASDKWGCLHD